MIIIIIIIINIIFIVIVNIIIIVIIIIIIHIIVKSILLFDLYVCSPSQTSPSFSKGTWGASQYVGVDKGMGW